MQLIRKLSLFAASLILPQSAFSAENFKKVYVVSPTSGNLVEVRRKVDDKLQSSSETIVMRDPNLDGRKIPEKAKLLTKPKKVAVKKPEKRPVAFKPMRVAASVRMPRVEFGKIALPVGLREESRSIDFADRSLSDLP